MKEGDVIYYGIFSMKASGDDDYAVFKATVESSYMAKLESGGTVEKWIAQTNKNMYPRPIVHFRRNDEYKASPDEKKNMYLIWGRDRGLVDKMCRYEIRRLDRVERDWNPWNKEFQLNEKMWFGRVYADEEIGAKEEVSVREEIIGRIEGDDGFCSMPCVVFESKDGKNIPDGRSSVVEYEVQGWESDGKDWPGYKYFSCWGKDRDEVETRLRAQKEKLIGKAMDRMDDEERRIEEKKRAIREIREMGDRGERN